MKAKAITSSLFALIIFIACNCTGPRQPKSISPEEQAGYIAKGKQITEAGFKALSGEVMKAIQEGGVQHASGYCHLQASPLIDSLSAAYKVKISRVSDKNRNPSNKPDELDQTVLDSYLDQLARELPLKPHLEITTDQVIYYSPILIANPACLLCHGEPGNTLSTADYEFIKTKYPKDLAVNYQMGQLRGVWKVEF